MLLVSAVPLVLSTTDSDAVGLHGDWGSESGEIAVSDSLPGSTASAGVTWEL
jgi:hypothetical protein